LATLGRSTQRIPLREKDSPRQFYAPSKLEGRMSSSSVSVIDHGEGGNHAVFDAIVKILFTTCDLSSPITCIFAKSQIASM
jgi:6-phosphogluconolactonase (cycloisomerase 2 family)